MKEEAPKKEKNARTVLFQMKAEKCGKKKR